MEREYIKKYADWGFQLRNKTAGGQNTGKTSIDTIERKGYQQGLKNGFKKAQKEIAKLFEKNLKVEINGNTNKLKQRALEKFKEFLGDEK